MIEVTIEDRMEAERIKIEYLKTQERLAIQALLSSTRSALMLEGTLCRSWLDTQALKMKDFSSKQVPADLEGGLTGGAADAMKQLLVEWPKPVLISPILL
ncbi:hypothetical protein [Streptococcus sp. DD13]|uniref:hypothetical protein n=1 Tax=Streptococcus sp. DD13 TaxID=1777881 RepID=UPI00079AF12A|nr:hypothetical protein [Streptococcus sp. DD13]KXT78438.1 hypothetical protein STRDD13_00741 [Streptococcus sp. DD13]